MTYRIDIRHLEKSKNIDCKWHILPLLPDMVSPLMASLLPSPITRALGGSFLHRREIPMIFLFYLFFMNFRSMNVIIWIRVLLRKTNIDVIIEFIIQKLINGTFMMKKWFQYPYRSSWYYKDIHVKLGVPAQNIKPTLTSRLIVSTK